MDDLPDPLPPGVLLRRLEAHLDERGSFTEVFRQTWSTGLDPVQWNVVSSLPGVLRGVHVHPRHCDFLVMVSGRASIGLLDLRPGAGDRGLVVEMNAAEPQALTIPPGVAHGFMFHAPSVHLYSTSEYFDPIDELGCRWDDPALRIPWPDAEVRLSPRDRGLPALAELRARLEIAAPVGR